MRRPLSELKLKSIIAHPSTFELIPKGEKYLVYGAAWSGEAEVVEVEVTTDRGLKWDKAEFIDPIQAHAWRRWIYNWKAPDQAGRRTLMSRARDAAGALQPDKHDDQRYDSYVIHHILPVEVILQ